MWGRGGGGGRGVGGGGGLQCRINNGANGAAAPGPPQLGAPHKGFFFCTLIFLHTISQTGLQRPPDPQLYCTLPPAALVWDTGAPILREKSPPLKFCTRPPTLVIRHWGFGGGGGGGVWRHNQERLTLIRAWVV